MVSVSKIWTFLGDFACLDGNSTAPPTPGTLGEEDYVVVSSTVH